MAKYISKRILYMIFVFMVMSLLLFTLFNMIPGDPARAEVEAMKDTLDPEEYQYRYEQARKTLRLDDPLLVRYGTWFKNVLKLDFGTSSLYKTPVIDVIVPRMKVTVFINIFAIILALGITIPLGIKSAININSTFDKVVQVTTIIGYSLPQFIFALLFIFLFAVKLRWFPVSGMHTPNFQGGTWATFLDTMKHLALPLTVMTIGSLGAMTRHVRANMNDALTMDYVKTARAKGLKERVVIYSHAWRNALLPVITVIIGWIIGIFGGSLIIESMFNLNGMGKLFVDALNNQDYLVALAVQMFYIVISIVGNFITDMSYGIVDPRVRIDQ